MRRTGITAALLALAFVAAACGDDDDAATTTVAGEAATTVDAAATTIAAGTDGGAGACAIDQLALKAPGTLTVATGESVFPPWMVDDDPTNQQGFESALVYALAGQMGFTSDQVVWVRTGFDEAVAPGPKDFDFNVQQYSITADRDEVVDLSDGYYTVEQALVAAADADIASATSLAELKDAQLGAAVGTTSLAYIDTVIQPDSDALVFDDNAAAKSSFDAGQVDGIVFDLPTAYYITDIEIPEASIVGVLPRVGEAEELGLLFEDGNPLVACVNEALAAIKADGGLEAIEEEWLSQGGGIPTLTE